MVSACPLGHGEKSASAAVDSAGAAPTAPACPLGHDAPAKGGGPSAATRSEGTAAAGGACPLGHDAKGSKSSTPAAAPGEGAAGGECPLGHGAKGGSAPPAAAAAAAGKPIDAAVQHLSRERIESSIPSTTGDPFMYPSEKQFYSSATAKGHDIDPTDMEMVVAIHNAVNEKAWEDILKFEKLHEQECPTPKLIRFLGRPGEISPKARFLGFMAGRTEPFDRHDWHVDRCGTHVRYIVDFYDGKSTPDRPVSIHVDARPEVTLGGVMDRFRLWAQNLNVV